MKKIILLLVVVLCIFSLCACGEKATEPVEEPAVSVASEQQVPEVVEPATEPETAPVTSGEEVDVDSLIYEFLNSEDFKSKAKDERKTACEEFLNDLASKDMIQNLSYDEEAQLFSYEYNGGILGGFSLATFDDEAN